VIRPQAAMALEDYIRRFRSQLVRTIAWQQMKPEPPDIPATRAVLTNLAFVTVYPVSALSHYSILLDHFFEHELFPRFEEARALRNASVARKIGSLREAVTSAMESSLHREKREDPKTRVESSELETLLRVVTGEVGEQRTVLDHAFRTLGETPDAVLNAVAQEAVTWSRASSESRISPLRLSEWIHHAITRSVQPPIDRLREVGQHAIKALQKIAQELGRNDSPSEEDFELLLRDLPRFELATLPNAVVISHWNFLGETVIRSRIRASLRESVGPHLKEELHLYGMALSQWSEQIVRKLEALVNSYADAYRVQLQGTNGFSGKNADPKQMETDLDRLVHWNAEQAPNLKAESTGMKE
jgi:hypothetical protein